MRKNLILLFSLLGLIIFAGNNDVMASNKVNSQDIEPRTYVIGKHIFQREPDENAPYKGILTVDYIMLAAQSIDSDDINDMTIYYKNPRGEWLNAVKDESVNIPQTFDIDYLDLEPFAPTLMVCKNNNGNMSCLEYDEFLENIDNYTEILDEKTIYYLKGHTIDNNNYHIEVLQKNGNEYNALDLNEDGYVRIELTSGEQKTFATRYYTLDTNNQKRYSANSNEITLNGKIVYQVTFNSHGGSDVATQTIEEGKKVTRPTNPTRDGYTFKEWQLNGVAYDFNSMVTGNITLDAVWDTYTITSEIVGFASTDKLLKVYKNGEQITVKEIRYLDNVLLTRNMYVEASDIAHDEYYLVVLNDETIVRAQLVS